MKCAGTCAVAMAIVCSGSAVHAHGDDGGAVEAAAPLLRSCKGKSAGAACSAKVARHSFNGMCVAFPADPFEGALVCVPPPVSCTTTCGASGQACCAPGNTCNSGLACQAGKCGTQPPPCDVTARLTAGIAAGLPGPVCLPRESVGDAAFTRLETCRVPTATCSGAGCSATLSWGSIVIDPAGEVRLVANVNAVVDVTATVASIPSTCTATLGGPLRVTIPVSTSTDAGGTHLTVTGSPSFDTSGLALSGCPLQADFSPLFSEVLNTYRNTLQIQLAPGVIAAIEGASASCP
jgi:hypothetical protein